MRHAREHRLLDDRTLGSRLRELAGEERNVQADFLLHLAVFDERRAFVDAGFRSLWSYCLDELHLSEGAAGRRIAAMKVLRRFARLEAPLRDGRLSLSTVSLLGPLLTEANLDDLVARAAFKTKADVDHLVATLQPRVAPKEGIRKLPDAPRDSAVEDVGQSPLPPLAGGPFDSVHPERRAAGAARSRGTQGERTGDGEGDAPAAAAPPLVLTPPAPAAPRAAVEVRAVSGDHWSMRVTIDRSLKDDLETLKNLLGHKIPDGDLAEVVREAIRCGIEKHGKRRGAVRPSRMRKAPPARRSDDPRVVPAELRRLVWERDGGRCAFVGEDGRRCECRFQLEIDHLDPVAVSERKPPTLDRLRLACRAHNWRYAEQVYGEKHMARFGVYPDECVYYRWKQRTTSETTPHRIVSRTGGGDPPGATRSDRAYRQRSLGSAAAVTCERPVPFPAIVPGGCSSTAC